MLLATVHSSWLRSRVPRIYPKEKGTAGAGTERCITAGKSCISAVSLVPSTDNILYSNNGPENRVFGGPREESNGRVDLKLQYYQCVSTTQ